MPKQKDGRYRAKITVGHDMYGEPIVKYASGRTKREMEEHKAELRRHYVEGIEDVKRDVLFGAYAQEWYEVYKKPTIGYGSQKNYDTFLNAHIIPEFGERQIKAIRASELQKFMNERAHLTKTPTVYLHSILRSVFKRALAEGIIARDPTVGLTKTYVEMKHKRALTAAEEAAILVIASTHTNGLLLLLLYYTGMRIGEALGLQWRDVDFSNAQIHVRRDIDFKTNAVGELKAAASHRAIPMPSALSTALDAVRGFGVTHVLSGGGAGHHCTESEYVRIWESIQYALLQAAPGIEKDEILSSKRRRKKNPEADPVFGSILTAHYFRHNYASLLYNSGVDVLTAQKWLGHANPQTTLSIYAHLSEEKEAKNAKSINAVFEKKLPESCLKK